MPAIKKVGNIVFTILNTLLIISLLIFSTILILSVNSNSPSILGFSSKLIFDRNDESAMLVISQTSSKLMEMDEFVYIAPDGVGIFIVDEINSEIISYRGIDNSTTLSLSTLSGEYGGKILVKNAQIGNILSTLVKTESMAVVYVLIIGTFSLLLLLLFLVHYLFKNKDRLVEYYEEVEEEVVDENGQTILQPLTMAESFEEITEMNKPRSNKKQKKQSKQNKDDVLNLIDGIEKNPQNPAIGQQPTQGVQLQTPISTRGKRKSTAKSTAMPASNYGDDVATFELEITEDTTSIDNDAFLAPSTLSSMYSEDDILAVLTEPNATFVVEEYEDDDYYEDGNVKYFSNGAQRPSLQESLMAYVHTNSDVDPEPPLPMAKTSEGIPIEWFEPLLEVASYDQRLPEVLLEDFEIKPVQIEEPTVNARDLIEKVEEMSGVKPAPKGEFLIISNDEEVEEKASVNTKPSADSLLQEIDSIFQKPVPPPPTPPAPAQSTQTFDEVDYKQEIVPTPTISQEEFLSEFTDEEEEIVNEDTILNEMKEQYG